MRQPDDLRLALDDPLDVRRDPAAGLADHVDRDRPRAAHRVLHRHARLLAPAPTFGGSVCQTVPGRTGPLPDGRDPFLGTETLDHETDAGRAVVVNRTFHDHECAYYDERFAIQHDDRSARQARAEVERLLGRPLRAGEVVLDPGCGTGWQAAGLRRAGPEVTVVGVDLSAGMLDKAREAGAAPLVQADATRLPLAAGSVDLVVTRGVLHHLPDVVGRARRLAPGAAAGRGGGRRVRADTDGRAARRGAGPRAAAAAAPAADADRGLLGAGLDGRQPARLHAGRAGGAGRARPATPMSG